MIKRISKRGRGGTGELFEFLEAGESAFAAEFRGSGGRG